MKILGYKLWLAILRGLILLKQGLWWVGRQLLPFARRAMRWYREIVGFQLYRFFTFVKKRFGGIHVPLRGRIAEFLGTRSTLQVVLFIIGFMVMIPHSELYTKDDFGIPGRQTLLYKLAPGDQVFEVEELVFDVEAATKKTDVPTYTEGAVTADTPTTGAVTPPPQELAGISAGGTAVTKPTILSPDAVTSVTSTGPTLKTRTAIVQHTVEGGQNLSVIAKLYGITVDTILAANNLSARSLLQPGDVINILPVDGISHTVKSGDTLGKIARTYDVGSEEIASFNKIENAQIRIGEQLIIPGGTKPAPVIKAVPVQTRKAPTFNRVSAPPPSAAPSGASYIWPAGARYITQYFGWRHGGLDIAGDMGTPIYAARAGTISKVSDCSWNGGYGCYIMIDHGGGVQTLYAHLDSFSQGIVQGVHVSAGQGIGRMGSTGRSTGPHLHFEVRINGRRQNPLTYIR